MKNLLFLFFGFLCLGAENVYSNVEDKKSVENSYFSDPYQILTAHYGAVGGLDALKSEKNSYAHGTIAFSGMIGDLHVWTQGLHYRREAHYPAFSLIEGDDGKQMWQIDLNKKRLIITDEKSKKRRRLRDLFEKFENADPESQYFRLKFIGLEKVDNEECYVIETKNTINDDIYYQFFSVKTLMLLRDVTQQPFLKIVTDYSDLKKINNIIYSFRAETNISPTGKKIISQINELTINLSIPVEKFSIPDNDIKDYKFEQQHSSESIPFLLVENNIYLPVTIQGETHYWVLDSGADMSVIDADYAAKIGLKSYGRLLGNATDNLVEFNFVKLKKYQIKGVELFEQTILAYQGLANAFFEPEAVGILGYDFLSRFVTKIDYANRQVSFFNPDFFSYKGKGNRVDSPLQDKLFMVSMIINGQFEGYFALDLGSYNLSMNYPFADKHGLMNQNGVLRLSSDIVGSFYEKQIKSNSLKIAGYSVNGELLNFPIQKGNGTNSDSEIDGLIGNSLLRHFILFLDYERQQLFFEKGDSFNHQFAIDKSGMTIGLSINDQPEIFHVAKGSAAQYAGIQKGDVITGIDHLTGKTLPGVTQLIKMLRAESGRHYKLSILRNKQEIIVNLQLKDIY